MNKIAFFTGTGWGSIGTAGTYNFAEKLSSLYNVLIFTQPKIDGVHIFDSERIKIIPYNRSKFLEKSTNMYDNILKVFDPQIVYIIASWVYPKLLLRIKEILPHSKYILDIKGPLLADESDRVRIINEGKNIQDLLDTVISTSEDNLKSWLANYESKKYIYPLSINTKLFPKDYKIRSNIEKRFILVSSIHPLRHIDILIEGFAQFRDSVNEKVILDIYGDGPDFERLNSIIKNNNFEDFIFLKGKMEQKLLYKEMVKYDAGIAWVPIKKYSGSPSLKILEYFAASLPVIATNTYAHLQLRKKGFNFILCEDNKYSLIQSLSKFTKKEDYKIDIIKNKNLVAQYDCDIILYKYILPALFNLLPKDKIKYNNNNIKIRKCSSLQLIFFAKSLAAGKGGEEKLALSIANEMIERGHIVYFLYRALHNKIFPAYKDYNERICLLPFNSIDEAKQTICNIDPDVLVLFNLDRTSLLQLIDIFNNDKIPICLHEGTNPKRLLDVNWKNNDKKLPKYIACWERDIISSRATSIQLLMPSYKNSYRNYIKQHIRAFPNFCPEIAEKAKPGNDKGRKNIIFINGFKPHKGFIYLLHAFNMIIHDFPDWDILMVGPTFPSNQSEFAHEVYDIIKGSHLLDRIIFTGPSDDIFKFYIESHIHVIASLSEGCPLVVLEAMSAGLPTIGYACCPGVNELIQHGVNGILISDNDKIYGLSMALRKLMSNPELRARFGQNAFYDSQKYSPVTFYDQWEKMLITSSEYKLNREKLFSEQAAIDFEAALHAKRMVRHFNL